MNKKQLAYFKNILLEKRKNILSAIERLKDESQLNDENFNKNNSFDNENFDFESQGKEEYFLILQREFKYLNQIKETLKSIDKGNYGICIQCNQKISHERLEAVPTTNTCVNCKTVQAKRKSFEY